ncbi:P-loop containing nucleoside triphosphate hydrolase protein [Thelonectria olida]|uniref:P-loop containing nucleoside triphosphate hydrolase protein n=1 Tax=Thelonectria olida TaxID=1576542 RepID=A0A9P9ALC0_9HYPO|nr:P-loop containing nucleoside triphosphate hydrolase protein [Thelonectria olida]
MPGLVRTIKLAIIGTGSVGKTSITVQACMDLFTQDLPYDPTEDNYRMQLITDERACILEFQEIEHLEAYQALQDQWIREADAYMLVYSIASRESFDLIRTRHDRIRDVRESCLPNGLSDTLLERWKSGPRILVANKADLKEAREVSTEEGEALARELGIDFMEVSAKNHHQVMEAVRQIVRVKSKWKDKLDQADLEAKAEASKAPGPAKGSARRLFSLRNLLNKMKRSGSSSAEDSNPKRDRRE